MCFLQVVVIALSYGVVFMGGGVGPSNYNNLWVLFGRIFFWSLTSCIFCPVFWCRVLSQGFDLFKIRNRKVHLWQWLYLKGCIIIFYHGLRFWQFCLKSNLSILLDATRKLPWVMTMRGLVRRSAATTLSSIWHPRLCSFQWWRVVVIYSVAKL